MPWETNIHSRMLRFDTDYPGEQDAKRNSETDLELPSGEYIGACIITLNGYNKIKNNAIKCKFLQKLGRVQEEIPRRICNKLHCLVMKHHVSCT